MESFYKDIIQKLENKTIEFAKHIEPKHKTILAKSYECMALCYKKNCSIDESSDCAEKYYAKITEVHAELQAIVENIQSSFQVCVQSCRLGSHKKEEESRQCISECTNVAINRFASSVDLAENIVNNYL